MVKLLLVISPFLPLDDLPTAVVPLLQTPWKETGLTTLQSLRSSKVSLCCEVLADVHAIQTHSLANVVTSLGIGGLLASLLGPLSFNISFLLIEWCKISQTHFFGILNVSVVLQILFILDFE